MRPTKFLVSVLLAFVLAPQTSAKKNVVPQHIPIQLRINGLIFDALSEGAHELRNEQTRPTSHFSIEAHEPQPLPWMRKEDNIKFLHAVAPGFISLEHQDAASRRVQKLAINEENIVAYTRIKKKHGAPPSYEIITFENLRDYNDYFQNTPYRVHGIIWLKLNKEISEAQALKKLSSQLKRIVEAVLKKHKDEIRFFLTSDFYISRNKLRISLGFGKKIGMEPKFYDDYVTLRNEYTLATLPRAMLPLPCDVEMAENAD